MMISRLPMNAVAEQDHVRHKTAEVAKRKPAAFFMAVRLDMPTGEKALVDSGTRGMILNVIDKDSRDLGS